MDNYDEFGKSVSLNKDYLLIGATGDDDGGSNKGAVYIFEKDSDGNWFKSFKISDNDSVVLNRRGRKIWSCWNKNIINILVE